MTFRTHPLAKQAVPIFAGILLVSFLALIVLSLDLVVTNYRPILHWDQWGALPFLFAVKQGTVRIRDFFAQNNEHRIFTSNILYVIDALCFHYRNAFLLTTIFVSHLTLGAIVGLLWFDRSTRGLIRASACLGCAAVMVSIVQYENLLWGFQTGFAHVYLFALLSLLALARAHSEERPVPRALLLSASIVFYALSAFTLANGVFLLVPALMLIGLMGFRRDHLIFVVCGGLVIAALFFYDYSFSRPDLPGHALAPLGKVAAYICIFFGAPFTDQREPQLLLGGFIVCTVAATTIHAFFTRPITARPAVLICLANFVLISAAATAIGRVGLGVEQSTSSRYATPALLMWVSTLGAARLMIVRRSNAYGRAASAALLGAVAIAALIIDANSNNWRKMSEWASRLDRGTAAILNDVYFTDRSGLDLLFLPPVIKDYAKALRTRGWNIFYNGQDIHDPALERAKQLPANTPVCRASVDSVQRLDAQRLSFRGWLTAANAPLIPSRIFVRDEPGGIVGYFPALDRRPDLATRFGSPAGNGFYGAVDFRRALPSGTRKITLIGVFDDRAEQTCAVDREIEVPLHGTINSYGELPLRALAGVQVTTEGRWQPDPRSAKYPPLPASEVKPLMTAQLPGAESTAKFEFPATSLGTDDLAILVGSGVDAALPIEVHDESALVESFALTVYRDSVWRLWRVAIVPRASLSATGRISIVIRVPQSIPAYEIQLPLPYATRADSNRAALF